MLKNTNEMLIKDKMSSNQSTQQSHQLPPLTLDGVKVQEGTFGLNSVKKEKDNGQASSRSHMTIRTDRSSGRKDPE